MKQHSDSSEGFFDPAIAAKITAEMMTRLEQEGFRARVISLEHMKELRQEIADRKESGTLDAEFYQVELAAFVFGPPAEIPKAQSIILVASPQPHLRMTFTWAGHTIPVYIPPTYSYEVSNRVTEIVHDILTPAGYHLQKASIPMKLTAVRSGLARYGKNNITYVEGMGSYHRLTALVSDLPCVADSWGEARALDLCETCVACRDKCPTGAIPSDRFLIHAERCLTFLNEFGGRFPAWLDSTIHHCLIGCLYCQSYCPVNRKIRPWVEESASFSAAETELILTGVSKDALPPETIAKLTEFGFQENLPEIARNLRAVLENPTLAKKISRLIRPSGN